MKYCFVHLFMSLILTMIACVPENSEKESTGPAATPYVNNNQPAYQPPLGSINSTYTGSPTVPTDVVITVNGTSSQTVPVPLNTQTSLMIQARSVNNPGRQIIISNVTIQPQVQGITVGPVGQATATVTCMPTTTQQVMMTVTTHDVSATTADYTAPAITLSIGGAGGVNGTSGGGNVATPMILGAGIGALSGMFSGAGPIQGALGGAMAGLMAGVGSGGLMGGGSPYMMGTQYNPYGANPMLMNSGMGQYPGYGYPGLTNGANMYGGYYGGQGSGYGTPGYLNGQYGYNPGMNNGLYNNGAMNGYGSSGYYNGSGSNSTIGSNYYYGNNSSRRSTWDRNSDSSFLTDSDEGGNAAPNLREGLAH